MSRIYPQGIVNVCTTFHKKLLRLLCVLPVCPLSSIREKFQTLMG